MTSAPLNIAVLVHNDVVQDARVRKQVRTLTEAGHLVDVYGVRKERPDYPATLEGAQRLVLADDFLSSRRGRILKRLKRLILGRAGSRAKESSGGPEQAPRAGAGIYALRHKQIARLLARQVTKNTYDVIHAHDMVALMAARYLKEGGEQGRVIWDAHEMYEHQDHDVAGAEQFIAQEIGKARPLIDSFVTISDSFSDYYEKTHGLPKAHVVMNATRHVETPADDGRLHRAAGLEPQRRILLFQGGLSPSRGIEALLAAAADLPEDWAIVFMGSGRMQPRVEEMRDRLAETGRAPAIALIPPAPHEELASWTAGASLGAIPYENVNLNHLYCTPNKLWEYPNAGVPILATDLEEMGRIVRTWGTGLLLPRDFGPADIVAALQGFDAETQTRLKANCARFSREMSWAQFELELLAAYAAEAGQKP